MIDAIGSRHHTDIVRVPPPSAHGRSSLRSACAQEDANDIAPVPVEPSPQVSSRPGALEPVSLERLVSMVS